MVLDDFVMLGTTVPEPSSDGRVFVCSAGISQEYGSLVRLYPLGMKAAPRRWQICHVSVERNPKDSRRESFKIAGVRDVAHHWGINYRIMRDGDVVPPEHRGELLRSVTVASIAQANQQRLSLAVIHPLRRPVLTFKANSPELEVETPQMSMFEDQSVPSRLGSKRFPHAPYLSFEDTAGKHRLQLRDWGSYEFLRKHDDDDRNRLDGALRMTDETSLLVGNMAHRRNVWLVISVLAGVREPDRLFDVETIAVSGIFQRCVGR